MAIAESQVIAVIQASQDIAVQEFLAIVVNQVIQVILEIQVLVGGLASRAIVGSQV